MPLTHRNARPLARDKQTFRDDRLFIIACDDTYAPKQYFNLFRIPRVQVHVVEATDGTSVAQAVLDRLLTYEHEEYDERWLLLDTDHCIQGPHLESFLTALREAKQKGIKVALSRPCFELWLLLHRVGEIRVEGITDSASVVVELRKILGEYNKTNLLADHYPLAAVTQACVRAKRLDKKTGGGEIPQGNTTRVYQIWHSICESALASQLPQELRGLTAGLDAI